MIIPPPSFPRPITIAVGFFAVACILLVAVSVIEAQDGKGKPYRPFEAYLMIDDLPAWIGDTLGYTVYEPTVVEARILSASGEIILLYRQGKQEPGQYMLPWDGTYEGSPLAGYYTFELYFGDEYAAKHHLVVNPLPKSP